MVENGRSHSDLLIWLELTCPPANVLTQRQLSWLPASCKAVSLSRVCFDLSSSISILLLVLNKELDNHQESSSPKPAHSSRSVWPLQRPGNPGNYWPTDKTGFVWETHSCTLTRMNYLLIRAGCRWNSRTSLEIIRQTNESCQGCACTCSDFKATVAIYFITSARFKPKSTALTFTLPFPFNFILILLSIITWRFFIFVSWYVLSNENN